VCTIIVPCIQDNEHESGCYFGGYGMIRLENITKIYNEKVDDTKALDDVSLKIEDGEFVAVMGASGSGKSTLLKIIGCMDTPTAGKYFLDNTEVTVASRSQVHKLRKEKIGYVFQHFALMDYYTAYEEYRASASCSQC